MCAQQQVVCSKGSNVTDFYKKLVSDFIDLVWEYDTCQSMPPNPHTDEYIPENLRSDFPPHVFKDDKSLGGLFIY